MPEDEDEQDRSENEIFYDEQIAPALLLLLNQCKARGMGFTCSVEYDVGSLGTTAHIPHVNGSADHDSITLAYLAARANGNIDGLGINWSKYCEKNNRAHNSIVLKYLGLDPDPNKR